MIIGAVQRVVPGLQNDYTSCTSCCSGLNIIMLAEYRSSGHIMYQHGAYWEGPRFITRPGVLLPSLTFPIFSFSPSKYTDQI
jgi:hypothetical protein